jgi:hypothetical protein
VLLLEKGPSGATEAVLLHELLLGLRSNIWNPIMHIVGEGNQARLDIDESHVQAWLRAEKGRWLWLWKLHYWFGMEVQRQFASRSTFKVVIRRAEKQLIKAEYLR